MIPEGIALGYKVLNHYKESRNHQESSHYLVLMNRQKKIEIQSNETQDEQERDDFKTPEGTRREGPPFPHNLSTSVSRIYTSNPREEREEKERETEREGGAG